jgi:hypothetical protein
VVSCAEGKPSSNDLSRFDFLCGYYVFYICFCCCVDVTKGFKVQEATFAFYFLIDLMDYDWSTMRSSPIKYFVVVLLFLFFRAVANESV